MWLDQVAFLDNNGVDLSIGGTVAASGVYTDNGAGGTSIPANAFDKRVFANGADTPLYMLAGWLSAMGVMPCWISYDHGSPKDVRQVMIRCNRVGHGANNLPLKGQLFVQYSDDNTNWANAYIKREPADYQSGDTVILQLTDYTIPDSTENGWWSCVPTLTPIAAWDAAHTAGAVMDDRVGTNNITSSASLNTQGYPQPYFNGNGVVMTFANGIVPPSPGLIVARIRPLSRIVLMNRTSTPTYNYIFNIEDNAGWYSAGPAASANFGMRGSYGNDMFVAIIIGATTNQMVFDSTLFQAVLTNATNMPTLIDRIGYGVAEYTLATNDRFYGAAFFSGTCTLADIATIRASMEETITSSVPLTFRAGEGIDAFNRQFETEMAYPAILAPLSGAYPLPPEGKVNNRPQPSGLSEPVSRARYVPGEAAYTATLSGNIGYVDGNNVPKRVLLIKRIGTQVVGDTVSDADGNYTFTGLNASFEYYAVVLKEGITGSPTLQTSADYFTGAVASTNAFKGPGHVSGTLKVVNVPAIRTVRLYDRLTGELLRTTQSAADGSFRFDGLEVGRKFIALGQDEDYPVKYNAAVADFLEAVL